MKVPAAIAIIAVAAIAGSILYFWSGAYDVAADVPHWNLTARVLEGVRRHSITKRATGMEVPDLEDTARIQRGAGNYDAMCAGCHLEPGVEQTELSAGLNPTPPNLSRRTLTDPAAAFWTIRHGIKMTGMPAWGKHMDEDSIWDMVAFLRKLSAMTPAGYRTLVASSGGHSHGEAPAEEAPASEARTHVHEDGSRHQH
jgi:mono/diheme cytochrome c family protein